MYSKSRSPRPSEIIRAQISRPFVLESLVGAVQPRAKGRESVEVAEQFSTYHLATKVPGVVTWSSLRRRFEYLLSFARGDVPLVRAKQ